MNKRRKSVLMVFALLNLGEDSKRDVHNHTLCILGGDEGIQCEKYLKRFLDDMRDLKTSGLKIFEHTFKVKFFWTSDWKFAAIVFGINSPG